MKVKSNEGLVALSEAIPNARFSVLGAWPRDDRLRALVETDAVDADALADGCDAVDAVSDFELRSAAGDVVRFEVSTPSPEPHGAMADSGIVPAFPLRLEDGWLVGEVVTSSSALSAFGDELREAGIPHDVTRVSPEREPSPLLTARQREVVETALERGYYDYPRECTLTDLAGTLEIDKSVASRILQRAEGRIISARFE